MHPCKEQLPPWLHQEEHWQEVEGGDPSPVQEELAPSSPVREREKDIMQQDVQRATKGLEHLTCGDGLFGLENGRLRGMWSMSLNAWRGKWLRWSPSLLSGAQWEDRRQWAQNKAQEIPFKLEIFLFFFFFPCEGSQMLGQVAQRSHGVTILGDWKGPWSSSFSWHCFEHGVGLGSPHRSPPTLSILWFCIYFMYLYLERNR